MASVRLPLIKRFNASFKKERGPNGCWLWLKYIDKDGYGAILVWKTAQKWKLQRAHRASYEIHYGKIPPKKFVLHTCDNPTCVNPRHLWLGNNQKNSDDKVKKKRQAWGERNGQAKLTASQVLQIRADPRFQRVICAEYNISQHAVSSIKLRKVWRLLP